MKSRLKSPVVILGAGPTGLGAAHMLHLSGFEDWILFEQDNAVGGLSRSYKDNEGYTWDLGGHVFFSHYGYFTRLLDNLLDESDWLYHERESWVRLLDRWVPYPFQNNIHYLPTEKCAWCLEGLIKAALCNADRKFSNFEEFIQGTFGQGVAELFLEPYNFKVWAYEPSKLDCDWIADRVSVPDPVRMARNAVLKKDDVAWGPNNSFRFPKTGGTGSIWASLADRIPAGKIVTGREAVEINPQAKLICFKDGTDQQYGTLINTIPLDRLSQISGRKEWIELSAGLTHSSAHIIGIGLEGRPSAEMERKCWMYFPEDNAPYYRGTHFSKYSPNNVDDITKHWSMMLEVSESPDKPVDASTVVEDTIRGLAATSCIEDTKQVVHTWHRRIEYAYPTPTIGFKKIAYSLLLKLQESDIYSRGRFGSWLYEVGNQDHSFMQGVEAAGHLLNGSPEITLWHPSLVNKPHPVIQWDLFR